MMVGGLEEEDDECQPARISSSRDPIVPRGNSSSSFRVFFSYSLARAIHATCRAGNDVCIYALDKDCVSKTDDDGLDLDHDDISLDTMVPASLGTSARASFPFAYVGRYGPDFFLGPSSLIVYPYPKRSSNIDSGFCCGKQLYLQRSRSFFGDQRNNPFLRLMCWHIETCRKRLGAVYVAQRILESTL
jgi:hypothetical protein